MLLSQKTSNAAMSGVSPSRNSSISSGFLGRFQRPGELEFATSSLSWICDQVQLTTNGFDGAFYESEPHAVREFCVGLAAAIGTSSITTKWLKHRFLTSQGATWTVVAHRYRKMVIG